MGASASSSSTSPSPQRWAAKAEELQDLSSEPVIFPAAAPPRSCSADHLGAIVDILGVPSGAPQFWENPRRLILSAEKRKVEMKRSVGSSAQSQSLGGFFILSSIITSRTESRLGFR